MRYLITGTKSPGRVILGYDGNGLLSEVQVEDMPNETAQVWPFRHAPLREQDVKAVFRAAHLKLTVLNVTFEDFWRKYDYKEGKKDTMKAWERMPEASRQLAFDYISRYKDACRRDRKHLQYPASYLRAERWLDHT
ncbi:MAG: hypothetical protein KIT10_14420 [Flavobacteriales bacterium]|nr:hypothetical protein [Flavobacteriales bacterium]